MKKMKTTFPEPTPTNSLLPPIQFSEKKNSLVPTAVATTSPTKQDDPFLYYSLSTNKLDGLRYALENEDDCGTDDEAERRTRFSVEVHPLHDAMFGTLLPGLRDDLRVWSDLIPHALRHIFS